MDGRCASDHQAGEGAKARWRRRWTTMDDAMTANSRARHFVNRRDAVRVASRRMMFS